MWIRLLILPYSTSLKNLIYLVLVKTKFMKFVIWFIGRDKMAGWHHQLDGDEFKQAPGVGDG